MLGPQNTGRIQEALAAVSGRSGISLRRAFLEIAGPFPVAGPAFWSNDWHAYRPCPYPHLHQGLDIFAARGTPVVAAADGWVTNVESDAISGLAVEIHDRSRIEYFYAHLEGFAAGLRPGAPIKTGDVLGYVGNTGDAAGGPTHLHFQIEPGGIPMPPKPVVDRWLLTAVHQAHLLVTQGRQALAKQRAADATRDSVSALPRNAATRPGSGSGGLEPASDRGASGGSLGAAAGLIAVIGVLGGLRYRRRRSPRRFAGPGASADLDSRSSELDGPPDDLIDEMLADIDLSNVLPEEWPDDVGAPSASAL